jgi:hypothetical protein
LKRSATVNPKRSVKPSRRSGGRVNSTRRKKIPPTGSLEYWLSEMMFAPASNRKRETEATIPGRSGHEMSRRILTCVKGWTAATFSG